MIFLFSCMNFKFACYILLHFSKCLYVDFFFNFSAYDSLLIIKCDSNVKFSRVDHKLARSFDFYCGM